MIRYVASVAWGALILASMVGWGRILRRLLRVGANAGWASNGALGIAFSTCLGGVFDLSGVISRSMILGYLALGAMAAAPWFARNTPLPDPPIRRGERWRLLALPILAAGITFLVIRIAGSVVVLQPPTGWQPGAFNTADDFQAYVVYPLKMIHAGTMGPDPFSIRRMPSVGLGGTAFLQTFVLATLQIQNIRILDVAIGTSLIVGLLWNYMTRLRVGLVEASSIVMVLLMIPPPLINITSVILPAALFISLFVTFVDAEDHGRRGGDAALIGIQVAAICALKTSLFPAALGFLVFHSALTVLRAPSKARASREVASWCICAGVALLPWLLDAYRWTGTLLPSGLQAYYAHPTRVSSIREVTGWPFLVFHLKELPRAPYAFVALVAAMLATKPIRHTVPTACWSLLGAVGAGTAGVTLAVAGAVNDLYRFMYAFVISGLLVSLVHLAGGMYTVRARMIRLCVVMLCGGAMALVLRSAGRETLQLYAFNASTTIRAWQGEELVSGPLAAKYRAIQSVVPAGVALLERMDHPYLFDFRRNEILLDDMPGSASLEPGMPFFAGSERLAAYLLSHGIRYVAYDYRTEAGTPHTKNLEALVNDDRHPSARAVVRLIFDFHDNLKQLGQTRRRLYDDGTAFVVDLLSRRT